VGFRTVVSAAMGAHYAFMAFGVFGGFLAWHRPRVLWLQALAAGWMVLIVVAHLSCPLTWIEDRARERAGMAPEPGGFIANHVAGVFFPHGYQPAAMAVAATIVLISWAGVRWRAGRSQMASASTSADS
jgi:Protein of Unknown function (DUF2784)